MYRCVAPRGPRDLTGASSPPPFLESPLPSLPTSHTPSLLPFRRPLFIRSPGIRGETWPHASSHGPNNGGYTRAPGLLFARSCFDEVGARPHNTDDLFLPPFCFFFSTLCFRCLSLSFSLLPFACSRFLCPLLRTTLHVVSSLSVFWSLKDYKRKGEVGARCTLATFPP